jgi:hypothetical protein
VHLIDVLVGLLRRDNWRKILSVDVILMCHDVDRAYDVDGLPYSQLLDPIRQQLEEQGIVCATVAHRFSRFTGRRAWGNPLSINRASFINVLANRAEMVLGRKTADGGASQRSIRFWERLLARSAAKMVVLIGAPPEVCIAARRRSVPVVELLHGFRYTSIPWGYESRPTQSLPSHVFTLDEISLNTFSLLEIRGCTVSLVQHPALTSPTDRVPVGESEGGSAGRETPSQRPTVLVALQWGYCTGEIYGGRFANGLFPDALIEVIERTEASIDWLFRLHPVQVRQARRYRKQIALVQRLQEHPNVLSMTYSQQPLSRILAETYCLLTPSSGTASEALAMGVPVVILDPDPSMRSELDVSYKNEISRGIVRFWDGDVENLGTLLTEVASSSWHPAAGGGTEPLSVANRLLSMLRGCEPFAA